METHGPVYELESRATVYNRGGQRQGLKGWGSHLTISQLTHKWTLLTPRME